MRSELLKKGEFAKGKKVLVMVHGRGATASDIMSLYTHLPVKEFTLVGPQAPGYTWYPYSFLAPPSKNEPSLSNSLKLLDEVVQEAVDKGVSHSDIYFLGFSQGACLTLEYVSRHARKWGGIIAFTGGLIGDTIYKENYAGNFSGTKIYIGSSDPDPHVPADRVRETELLLTEMGAEVKVEIFKDMGHTIIAAEMEEARKILS